MDLGRESQETMIQELNHALELYDNFEIDRDAAQAFF